MPGLIDKHKFAAWPIRVEPPGGDQWSSYVQAAMDQDARSARKKAGALNKNIILMPALVPPVARDETGKSQPKGCILPARIWLVV